MSRVFILGAGFSKPAGLPIANELLDLVIAELTATSTNDGGWTHLHGAVDEYKEYLSAISGVVPDPLDIEHLVEYLDNRHWFGQLGSDTWSREEGNLDQFLLRWGIGRVLHQATRGELRPLYASFVDSLEPRDIILTFNYDLVVETALTAAGKPFRRYPFRWVDGEFGPTFDLDDEEILVIKLHGSLDWVSRASFDRTQLSLRSEGTADVADHAVEVDLMFGPRRVSNTTPLLSGPGLESSVFNNVERIESLDGYYARPDVAYFHPPLILVPSRAKQLYGGVFRELWNGIGQWASGYAGLNIIGYSLPDDDSYVKQVLWQLSQGYVHGLNDMHSRMADMARINVVDFRTTPQDEQSLRNNYRFLPDEHTDYTVTGFDDSTLPLMFPVTPYKRVSERHETDESGPKSFG